MEDITGITDILVNCSSFTTVVIEYTTTAVPYPQRDVIDVSRAFSLCCRVGNLEGAKMLANYYDKNINVGMRASAALRWACKYGHLAVVLYLHANHRDRLNIRAHDNYALRMSCKRGHTNIVRFLLSNWVDLIDVTARDCEAFRMSCKYSHYHIARLLLEKYGSVISSCKAVFADGFTLLSIYHCRWSKIARMLFDDSKVIINRLQPGLIASMFEAVCQRGWLRAVQALINSIDNTEVRKYLINRTLVNSYSQSLFDVCIMLLNNFGSDVSAASVNTIYGSCQVHTDCKYIGSHQDQHLVLDLIVHRFKDAISFETYGRALKYACVHICCDLLRSFEEDLSDKITCETLDQILIDICSMPSVYLHEPIPAVILIRRFKDRLGESACKAAFASACAMKDPVYVAVCLECIIDRIDLTVIDDDLKIACLSAQPRIAISIIRAYGHSLDESVISTIIDREWSNEEIVQALIMYCRDRINTQVLNTAITNMINAKSSTPQFGWPSIRLLLSEFRNEIDHTITAILLGLPSETLYYLLCMSDIRELVNRYRYKAEVIEAITTLDPDHPNTRYILADYIPESKP